ncbi:MAG: cytochrome c [Gemmatimonadota bacterium]
MESFPRPVALALTLFTIAGCASSAGPADSPAPQPEAAPVEEAAAPVEEAGPRFASETPVYSEAQATRGRDLYDVECATCHGPREFSGTSFLRRWSGGPVGSLFGYINGSMPQMSPGILTYEETADIVAYVLSLNGFPAGNVELPSEPSALAEIRYQPSTGR